MPDELRANREIVLAVMQKHDKWLQYVSAELQADREIVLAAVQKNGSALEYASVAIILYNTLKAHTKESVFIVAFATPLPQAHSVISWASISDHASCGKQAHAYPLHSLPIRPPDRENLA